LALQDLRPVTLDKIYARPAYHDQILPFEVVINAANEYGSFATMKIHNVEILNCGSGMSIDDISTDEACTFIATAVTPWNADKDKSKSDKLGLTQAQVAGGINYNVAG
jgi:hypothetical protein